MWNDLAIALALWLAALSLPAHALAAGDARTGTPPDILVLHSYNPGLSWTEENTSCPPLATIIWVIS